MKNVVFPAALSLAGIVVVACGMAAEGWQRTSLELGAILVIIAGLMVVRIHRGVRTIHDRSRAVHRAADEAEDHYVSVLQRVIRFSELKDGDGVGRSERVGRLTVRLAEELGLGARETQRLGLAGRLHDIGLLAVPEQLLAKPAELSGKEYRAVQRHSEISYDVLKPLRSFADILPAVRHHHERMNGTGYPGGLVGEDIPLGARVLAVADAYDAMTHDRPHRPALTSLSAFRELQRCSPDGFDPAVIKALGQVIQVDTLADVQAAQEHSGHLCLS